jgi:hypothetical protein
MTVDFQCHAVRQFGGKCNQRQGCFIRQCVSFPAVESLRVTLHSVSARLVMYINKSYEKTMLRNCAAESVVTLKYSLTCNTKEFDCAINCYFHCSYGISCNTECSYYGKLY